MDCSRASDFHGKANRRRSPSGDRSRPRRRGRYSSPARLRSPSLQSLPAENLRIHWGLLRPYNEPTWLSGHRARPLDRPVPPSSFANSVWQQAETCNRSRAREPNRPSDGRHRPLHSTDASDCSRSRTLYRALRDRLQPWDYPTWPAPADPYQHMTQPTSYQEPRASRTMLYDLNQPSRGHHQDAQFTQNSSAVPLGGHSLAPRPRHRSRDREPPTDHRDATPPPVLDGRPPAQDPSDTNSSGAEDSPQWSYSCRSPPHKAPRRADNDFAGYHRHTTPCCPEPHQDYPAPKQASVYLNEPKPSTSRDQTYTWPPPLRDFTNDRVESLASAKEEPYDSFAVVIDMI